MAKTNSGLVAYAKAQVGLPYWYGTYGQQGSASLYASKKKQYPSYYTASDFSTQYGKRVHDCVGLIKGYLWSTSATATPTYNSAQDKSAAGMYAASKSKGGISTFPKKLGQLVYKGTGTSSINHVGIYDGAGYVYEAKGHAYGVVKTAFKSSDWQFWSQCPYCTDDSSTASSSSTTTSLAAGAKVTLVGAKLYSTATTATVSATKSGTYYVWNATISNGRIRVTNKAASVGKSGQITGWVSLSDIPGATASGTSTASSSTSTKKATDDAESYSKALAGTYKVTASTLNIRNGAGTGKSIMATIPKGTSVTNYGYYTATGGVKWLYVQATYKGTTYAGFCSSAYLAKA